MRIVYHPEAIEDGRLASEWYAAQGGEVADRFEAAVRAAIGRVVKGPASHPEVAPGVRRILVKTFPFQVVYRVQTDVIQVVAIAHTKRRPRYWSERIGEQPRGE